MHSWRSSAGIRPYIPVGAFSSCGKSSVATFRGPCRRCTKHLWGPSIAVGCHPAIEFGGFGLAHATGSGEERCFGTKRILRPNAW